MITPNGSAPFAFCQNFCRHRGRGGGGESMITPPMRPFCAGGPSAVIEGGRRWKKTLA
jgi:hypothetical protein